MNNDDVCRHGKRMYEWCEECLRIVHGRAPGSRPYLMIDKSSKAINMEVDSGPPVESDRKNPGATQAPLVIEY